MRKSSIKFLLALLLLGSTWVFTPLQISSAATNLNATAHCSGSNLILNDGPGLPVSSAGGGSHTFFGPALFGGVEVIEKTGDVQDRYLGYFNCGTPGLVANHTGGFTRVNEQGATSDTYTVNLASSPNVGETVTVVPIRRF
jgi:hypothetical protein